MKYLVLLCLLCFACCSSRVNVQTQNEFIDSQEMSSQQKVDLDIANIIKGLKIPGLSIAVSKKGQTIYSNGFGYRDIENKIQPDAETIFRLASVSKVITAAGIAKLVDLGKLDINAPVETYLKEFTHVGSGITTKLLAAHLGGIRHYSFKDGNIDNTTYKSTDEALEIFINDELLHKPGSKYKYSTFAFTLLQAVIEGASGQPYLEFMNENIFKPLDMNRTFPDIVQKRYSNKSKLYRLKSNGEISETKTDNPSYKWGGGGMTSTVDDLLNFGNAHLQPGFFSSETLEMMFTEVTKIPNSETGIGLTWRLEKDNNERPYYHHAGNMNGARSFIMIRPHDHMVVAILSNNRQLDFIDRLGIGIADYFSNNDQSSTAHFDKKLYKIGNDEFDGLIEFSGSYPYYHAILKMSKLSKIPVHFDLIGSITDDKIYYKNLKVRDQFISLVIDIDYQDGTISCRMNYNNDKNDREVYEFNLI